MTKSENQTRLVAMRTHIKATKDRLKVQVAEAKELFKFVSLEKALAKAVRTEATAKRATDATAKRATQIKKAEDRLAKLKAEKNPVGNAARRASRKAGPVTVIKG